MLVCVATEAGGTEDGRAGVADMGGGIGGGLVREVLSSRGVADSVPAALVAVAELPYGFGSIPGEARGIE